VTPCICTVLQNVSIPSSNRCIMISYGFISSLSGTEVTQTLSCSLYRAQCCSETEEVILIFFIELALNATFVWTTVKLTVIVRFCAFNRLLIQHSLTLIAISSTLSLPRNFTQFTVGADFAAIAKTPLLSTQNNISYNILYIHYYLNINK